MGGAERNPSNLFENILKSYSSNSPTHPLTYSPIHPPTHPLTYSPTHPLTHSPTHPLTHSPTHPLTHSPTHPLTHSPTHPLTHSPIHPLTHSPTHPFTHSPLTCVDGHETAGTGLHTFAACTAGVGDKRLDPNVEAYLAVEPAHFRQSRLVI